VSHSAFRSAIAWRPAFHQWQCKNIALDSHGGDQGCSKKLTAGLRKARPPASLRPRPAFDHKHELGIQRCTRRITGWCVPLCRRQASAVPNVFTNQLQSGKFRRYRSSAGSREPQGYGSANGCNAQAQASRPGAVEIIDTASLCNISRGR